MKKISSRALSVLLIAALVMTVDVAKNLEEALA